MKTRILTGLAGIALALTSGCSTEKTISKEYNVPTASFNIPKNNFVAGAINNITKQELYEFLRNCALNSVHEKAYAFFPELNQAFDMVENSYTVEGEDFFGETASLDYSRLNDYLEKNPNIRDVELIHTHPESVRKKAEESYRLFRLSGKKVYSDKDSDLISRLLCIMPSYFDINLSIHDLCTYKKSNPNVNLKHKIVSYYGVTTYGLSSQGLEYFLKLNDYGKKSFAYSKIKKKSIERAAISIPSLGLSTDKSLSVMAQFLSKSVFSKSGKELDRKFYFEYEP